MGEGDEELEEDPLGCEEGDDEAAAEVDDDAVVDDDGEDDDDKRFEFIFFKFKKFSN